MQEKQPICLFYSYSHKDERIRDQLETHLALLKRRGVIDEWHDRKIGAGQHIDDEIDRNLAASHISLLLVSADFLHSDYCYKKEMARALERDKAGEARVIPVIIRPVDWKGAPFRNLKALPKDGKPVTKWGNRDEAWANVAEGIRAAVEDLTSNRSQPDASSAPGAQHSQPSSMPVQPDTSVGPLIPVNEWLIVNQPHLVPIEAKFGGMTDGRLQSGADHEIVLLNLGTTKPSDINAVLFPSSTYIVPNTMPQQRTDLHGTFWHGRLGAMSAGNGPGTIRLQEARAPLRGDMSVLGGHRLFAPEEPPLGAFLAGHGDFRSARLTITFRDGAGRRLATAFDLDGYHLEDWHRIAGPEVVAHDLAELTHEAALGRAERIRQKVEEPGARPTPGGPQMTKQSTKQEVEALANTIRAELARTPALAFITVAQVVDNAVDSQNPRGWSVQLLNARAGNLPIYVSTYQEWEAFKAELLA